MNNSANQLVYKILTTSQRDELIDQGVSNGAPIDLQDGYIHFSARDQVRETAAKHFAGQRDLHLAAANADALGDALKWEPSRGGALFPHLYRPMRAADMLWISPLPLGEDGAHLFPNLETGEAD